MAAKGWAGPGRAGHHQTVPMEQLKKEQQDIFQQDFAAVCTSSKEPWSQEVTSRSAIRGQDSNLLLQQGHNDLTMKMGMASLCKRLERLQRAGKAMQEASKLKHPPSAEQYQETFSAAATRFDLIHQVVVRHKSLAGNHSIGQESKLPAKVTS